MYAVFITGGKQYKVKEGQIIKVEKLNYELGDAIDFDKVLLTADGDNVKVGAPYVDGAKVLAEVVEHGRQKKVYSIRFKRRKHSLKQMGHRQYFTAVKIKSFV